MLCAGRFRGALCIFFKPGVLLNTLLYSVPGFRFQHFLLILFKNTPTCRLTELKSICGKVFKISSFTCNFFIAGEFYKNENTFLRGFIMGKSDIISIGSPRPFPLPAASDGARWSDWHHLSIRKFSWVTAQLFNIIIMSFAMQNPGRHFIFACVFKPEAIEGAF